MKRTVPVLFILPTILVLLAVALYPMSFGIWAGFHQWNWAIGQADHWIFIGVGNYASSWPTQPSGTP